MNEQQAQIKKWLANGSINIFGLPFAGKDTQGEILADMLGGIMISSGDILRNSKDNQRLQELLAAGEIIPSEIFLEIIPPYFARPELSSTPLILSEVGRMEGEQQVTFEAAEANGHGIKALILLNMPDEEVYRRFDASQQQHDRGDRADDNRQVLKTRLEKYHQIVTPVIEWYRKKGLLIEIDGSLEKEKVTQDIVHALYKLAITTSP